MQTTHNTGIQNPDCEGARWLALDVESPLTVVIVRNQIQLYNIQYISITFKTRVAPNYVLIYHLMALGIYFGLKNNTFAQSIQLLGFT